MAHKGSWHKDKDSGQYVHEASVVIDAPVEACFGYWTDFALLPTVMQHVTEVKRTGDNVWHWEVDVAGRHQTWDAKVTEIVPNDHVSWESTKGTENSGTVSFAPEGRGCKLTVHLMYDPPYSILGDWYAERNINDQLTDAIEHDLLEFKVAVESWEAEQYRRAA